MRVKRIAVFLNIILQLLLFNSNGLSQHKSFIYPAFNKSIDYYKEKVGCNRRPSDDVFIIKLLDFNLHKGLIKYSLIELLDLNNLNNLNFFGFYYYKGDIIVITQTKNLGIFIQDSLNICINKDSLNNMLKNQTNEFHFVNYFEEGLINSPTIGVFEFKSSNCRNKHKGKLNTSLIYPLIIVPVHERPITNYFNTFEYIIDSIGKIDRAPWKNCPLYFKKGKVVDGMYKETLKVNFNR